MFARVTCGCGGLDWSESAGDETELLLRANAYQRDSGHRCESMRVEITTTYDLPLRIVHA